MTHILSLGAINKQTGDYVYPKIANKKDEYVCPDCNKDLILCQGEIKRPHFRHKVDSVNPCNHYSNPTETQIHKDGKMVMKSLLERKTPISFIRNCCSCKKNEEYEIPEMTESSKIELEYRFEYNGTKIADVAYIDNDDILCIFEICNTHKTCSENRPEPWFEIYAETLIKLANDSSSQIKIRCIRCEKCENCIETEYSTSNNYNKKESLIKKREKLKDIKRDINFVINLYPEYKKRDYSQIEWANKKCWMENMKRSLTQELKFIENDIFYKKEKNGKVIEHPLTHTKLTTSMFHDKILYKGKWRTDISIQLIINWYSSNYDLLD